MWSGWPTIVSFIDIRHNLFSQLHKQSSWGNNFVIRFRFTRAKHVFWLWSLFRFVVELNEANIPSIWPRPHRNVLVSHSIPLGSTYCLVGLNVHVDFDDLTGYLRRNFWADLHLSIIQTSPKVYPTQCIFLAHTQTPYRHLSGRSATLITLRWGIQTFTLSHQQRRQYNVCRRQFLLCETNTSNSPHRFPIQRRKITSSSEVRSVCIPQRANTLWNQCFAPNDV